MPRLQTVSPDQAGGEVKEIYDGLKKNYGKVFNIFQGMGNSAAALQAYLAMSTALSQGELSATDREVVYIGVSEANECNYCVSAHTAIAKKAGMKDEEIKAVRRSRPESSQHEALLSFVRKVMSTHGFVGDQDIEEVRQAGYTDGQIAEAVAYIGLATYSNYFNHVYDTPLDFPQAPSL